MGAALAVLGIAALELWYMGPPVTPLVVALVLSYLIWRQLPTVIPSRTLWLGLGFAMIAMAAHLAEEVRTGFYREFPRVFGAEPWSVERFLIFNAVWTLIFLAAAIGVARRNRAASLAMLFLAIGAGIGNGLGHIALAARAGEYFPGLYTAPLVLVAGAILLRGMYLQRRPSDRA